MFPLAVNVMLPVVQFVNILYGNKFSYTARIIGGFILTGALIVLLPIVSYFMEPSGGFGLCIVIMVAFGTVSGMLQGSVFGMAGMLPPKYMGAVMFGNGLSGIAMNVLDAICIAAFPPDKGNNRFIGSLIFFIIATLILICAALAQIVL